MLFVSSYSVYLRQGFVSLPSPGVSYVSSPALKRSAMEDFRICLVTVSALGIQACQSLTFGNRTAGNVCCIYRSHAYAPSARCTQCSLHKHWNRHTQLLSKTETLNRGGKNPNILHFLSLTQPHVITYPLCGLGSIIVGSTVERGVAKRSKKTKHLLWNKRELDEAQLNANKVEIFRSAWQLQSANRRILFHSCRIGA